MRDLLRGAAASPSRPADVAAARRRGRRMRVQRRALSGIAIVAIVALGSVAIANLVPSNDAVTPATQPPAPAFCAPTRPAPPIPSWARSANPPAGLQRVLSPDGNVLAVLFSALFSPPMASPQNKILFVVRQPRAGKPLAITATRPGSPTVNVTQPAGASPGEIYPTILNLPTAGCWHLALAWNGHHAAINLRYVAPPPPPTTGTTVPTSTGTPTPTSCQTKDLTLSLGPQIGSAGHFNYEIAFKNTGTLVCTMTGFPGVSFLDAQGHQIGVPAGRNTLGGETPVTLLIGATAYAHLAVVDTSVQNCPPAAAQEIRVFPPNETVSANIAVAGLEVCSNQTRGATIDPVLDHSR